MRAPPLRLLLLPLLALALRAQGLRLIPELPPLPERSLVLRGPPPAEAEAQAAGAAEMAALGAALDADQQRLDDALAASAEPPPGRRARRQHCFTVLPELEDAVLGIRTAGRPREQRRTSDADTRTTAQIAGVKDDNGGDGDKKPVLLQASTRNPRDTVSDGSIPQRRLQVLLSMKEDLLRERASTPESIRMSNRLVRRSLNASGRKGKPLVRRASPIDLSVLARGSLAAVRMAEERSFKTRVSTMGLKRSQGVSEKNRAHSAALNADVKSVKGDVFTPRAAFVTDQQSEEDDDAEEISNDDEVATEMRGATASRTLTTSHQPSEENQEWRTVTKTPLMQRKFQTPERNVPSQYSSFQRHTAASNAQGEVRRKGGYSPSSFGNVQYHQIAHVDDVIAGLMALQAQRRNGDTAEHLAPRHGFLHRHHLTGVQREPLDVREPSTVLSKTKSGGRTTTPQLTKISSHHRGNKIENTYIDVGQSTGKIHSGISRSRTENFPSVHQYPAYEAKEGSGGGSPLLNENRQNNGEGVMLGFQDFQLHEPTGDGFKNQEAASPESHNNAVYLAIKHVPTKDKPEKDTSENIRSDFEAEDNRNAILILPSALVHKQSMGNNHHTVSTQEGLVNDRSSNIYSLASRQEIRHDINTSPQPLVSVQGKRDDDDGTASLMSALSNCQPGNVDNEKRKGVPPVGIEGEGRLTVLSFKFRPVMAQKSRSNVKNCLTKNSPSSSPCKKKMDGVIMPETLLLLHPVTKDNIEDNSILSSTKSKNGKKSFKANVHQETTELTGEELQSDNSENSPINDGQGILKDWEKNSREPESQGIKGKNVGYRVHDIGEDNFKRFVFPPSFSASHQYSDQRGKEKIDDVLSLVTAKGNRNGLVDSLYEETSQVISTGGMEKQIGNNIQNDIIEPLVVLLTHNEPSDSDQKPAQINIKESQGNDFRDPLSVIKKANEAELTDNMEFNANKQLRKRFGKVYAQTSLDNEDKKRKVGNGKYNKQFRNNEIEDKGDSMKLVDSEGDKLASNLASNKFHRKGTKEDNEQPFGKIAKVNNFKADEQSIIMYNRNLMPCAVEKRDNVQSSGDHDEKLLARQSTLFVDKNDVDVMKDSVTSGDNEYDTPSSKNNEHHSSSSQNQPVHDGSQFLRNSVLPTSLKEKAWTIVGVPNIIQQLTSTETPSSTLETKSSGINEQNGFGISKNVNLKNSDLLSESKMSASGFIQSAKAAPGTLNADFSNQENRKLDSNFDQQYAVENVKAIHSHKSHHKSDTTQVSAIQNNPQENIKPSQSINGGFQEQQAETFRESSSSSPSSNKEHYFPERYTTKTNSGEDQTNVKDKTHKIKAVGRKSYLKENRRKAGNHGTSCHVSIYLEDPKNVAEEMVRTVSDKASKSITSADCETKDNQKPCACKIHVAREDHEMKAKGDLRTESQSQAEMEVANLNRDMEPAVHGVSKSPRYFKSETQPSEALLAESSEDSRAALAKREEPSGNLIWIKEDSDRKGTSPSARQQPQQQSGKRPPAGPCALIAQPEHVQRLLNAEAGRDQRPQPQPLDEDEDLEGADRANHTRRSSTVLALPQASSQGIGATHRPPGGGVGAVKEDEDG